MQYDGCKLRLRKWLKPESKGIKASGLSTPAVRQVSIIFAVLFRRSLELGPRSYIALTGRHSELWKQGAK
jgi:hypothetical protein